MYDLVMSPQGLKRLVEAFPAGHYVGNIQLECHATQLDRGNRLLASQNGRMGYGDSLPHEAFENRSHYWSG
jgi:hypothetical protein